MRTGGGGGIGNTREKTIFEREYLVVDCVRTIETDLLFVIISMGQVCSIEAGKVILRGGVGSAIFGWEKKKNIWKWSLLLKKNVVGKMRCFRDHFIMGIAVKENCTRTVKRRRIMNLIVFVKVNFYHLRGVRDPAVHQGHEGK